MATACTLGACGLWPDGFAGWGALMPAQQRKGWRIDRGVTTGRERKAISGEAQDGPDVVGIAILKAWWTLQWIWWKAWSPRRLRSLSTILVHEGAAWSDALKEIDA